MDALGSLTHRFTARSSLRKLARLAIVASLASPISVVSAQTPTTVVVVGVADAESGQPLTGAQVLFPALSRVALTDALGEARLANVPSGTHRIRIRFLGYAAVDTSLQFTGDTTGIVFRLPRVATTIEGVSVKAASSSNLRDFEMRRGIGLGRYLTAEQLEKDGNRPFAIVAMTRFPGLQYVTDGDGRPHIASMRGSCGGATSPSEGILAGARGGGSGGRGAATTGGSQTGSPGSNANNGTGPGNNGTAGASQMTLGSCTPGRPCYVVTFLDNIQLDSADFDLITTWDVGGVEYYSGNNVPPRYRVSGAACGVLLVWSK